MELGKQRGGTEMNMETGEPGERRQIDSQFAFVKYASCESVCIPSTNRMARRKFQGLRYNSCPAFVLRNEKQWGSESVLELICLTMAMEQSRRHGSKNRRLAILNETPRPRNCKIGADTI